LIECLGTIDELNAFLGDAAAAMADQAALPVPEGKPAVQEAREIITGIQEGLSAVLGVLAGSGAGQAPDENHLMALITKLEAGRSPLSSFAVPGADPVSAKLHIARTVCRRAERRLVSLDRAGALPAGVLPWFNRLSDLLFLLAEREEQEIGAAAQRRRRL
jgi:cob(I)alamin adenosyltransferase